MTTEKARRVYVGNGKATKNGNPVNFSINLEKLRAAIEQGTAQTYTTKAGEVYVKLTMWANDEPDRFDNTHAVCLDQFVPTPRSEAAAPANDLSF